MMTLVQYDDLYCRLFWVWGQDWAVTAGQEEGVTQVLNCFVLLHCAALCWQVSRKSLDAAGRLVWNFPLSITLKSTSPHGWPQVIFATIWFG